LTILQEHHHGSIVATLYAMGYKAKEMREIFKEYCGSIKYIEISNILKVILSKVTGGNLKFDGLNKGRVISNLVKKVGAKKGTYKITDIKMPIYIPSVDLSTGNLIVFTSAKKRKGFSDDIIYINDIDIATAVRASCSYPGIFSPVRIKELVLADGGIRENVPWSILKKSNCDYVFSIIFKEVSEKRECNNIFDVINTSFDLICRELANYELNGANYLLEINLPYVSLLDCSKVDELYILGYRQCKEYIRNNFNIFKL